jgi:uncharacterized membrane protein
MINHHLQRRQRCAYRLILLFAVITFAACTSQPKYSSPATIGTDVVVEIASLQPETPRFFTYQYHGKNISFFVMNMKSGVQSYFDACASCYPHKRGYHYEKGTVTCRNCDQHFSVNKLDKGLGGCFPIKIEGRTEKGKYLIPLATLEAEVDKF